VEIKLSKQSGAANSEGEGKAQLQGQTRAVGEARNVQRV